MPSSADAWMIRSRALPAVGLPSANSFSSADLPFGIATIVYAPPSLEVDVGL